MYDIFSFWGVDSQVLFWATEENEIERLKSRLSEFYYENLRKVNTILLLVFYLISNLHLITNM